MVKEIIQKGFIRLTPQKTVGFSLKEMETRKKSVAVVVDENDYLLGIVVKADLFRFLREPGHYEDYPVELAMTKSVITVKPDDDILKAAKMLRENNISAIPVIDDENKVVGIIGLEDIVDYCIQKNSLT
ncbi:CBS domain-containing protein [Thermosyntropha lipolytica DSM 11003]|uniref:CBS domain-containing protein n=1 Tax=Thermosyntropha lipolytica DSM 11003 TaxID=1123382 RepID=A0A1M5PRJ8_9FIRM|nr:CBS domain-containing protein [Thermosyntropha lipolytica]SHH03953.1 CBS domain-containing protein [Thermosyntropha lipolytica DSM 11003]